MNPDPGANHGMDPDSAGKIVLFNPVFAATCERQVRSCNPLYYLLPKRTLIHRPDINCSLLAMLLSVRMTGNPFLIMVAVSIHSHQINP